MIKMCNIRNLTPVRSSPNHRTASVQVPWVLLALQETAVGSRYTHPEISASDELRIPRVDRTASCLLEYAMAAEAAAAAYLLARTWMRAATEEAAPIDALRFATLRSSFDVSLHCLSLCVASWRRTF